MKRYLFPFLVSLVLSGPIHGQAEDLEPETPETLEGFMGRWTLDLPGGAGWLHLHNANAYLDAELLWKWGSVRPVSSVHLHGNRLVVTRLMEVVRERDAEGNPIRTHQLTQRFEFNRGVDELVGKASFPARDGSSTEVVHFTGKRLPALPPAPDVSAAHRGEPIPLFNGRDLSGWRLIDPGQKNGFKAENGVLWNDPVQPENDPHHYSYGNLRTEQEFEDFNLSLEVNFPEGSNSGVYLRGIYEIQVVDSYGKPLNSHHMGALYSRIAPSVAAEKPAGEWQSLDITLYQQHLTVLLNGVRVIDNAPVLGVTGGAISSDPFKPGPIYLQGDHGEVMYRNLVLTPLK